MNERKPRRRWRRKDVAKHFGGVNIRTVDAWVKKSVIPPPHYLPGSVIPFWFEDQFADQKSNQSAV